MFEFLFKFETTRNFMVQLPDQNPVSGRKESGSRNVTTKPLIAAYVCPNIMPLRFSFIYNLKGITLRQTNGHGID